MQRYKQQHSKMQECQRHKKKAQVAPCVSLLLQTATQVPMQTAMKKKIMMMKTTMTIQCQIEGQQPDEHPPHLMMVPPPQAPHKSGYLQVQAAVAMEQYS